MEYAFGVPLFLPGLNHFQMHVICTYHLDASDADEAGFHEYHYEYYIFQFSEGEESFFARSYTDEPHRAHFLNAEKAGRSRPLTTKDSGAPLFLEAQAYLRQAGKTELSWLSGKGNGYEPLQNPVIQDPIKQR
ncbi:hypothetical protein [Comamonas sp. JNW]|uniref:hypothetical protein n=1 Tax=unclassified Comamonas TaxID=2638500 RepID=UPI001A9C7964|nr:hypothetical protein [Comamonas sp. JNW]